MAQHFYDGQWVTKSIFEQITCLNSGFSFIISNILAEVQHIVWDKIISSGIFHKIFGRFFCKQALSFIYLFLWRAYWTNISKAHLYKKSELHCETQNSNIWNKKAPGLNRGLSSIFLVAKEYKPCEIYTRMCDAYREACFR